MVATKDRIIAALDELPEEKLASVADYVEFLRRRVATDGKTIAPRSDAPVAGDTVQESRSDYGKVAALIRQWMGEPIPIDEALWDEFMAELECEGLHLGNDLP